LPAVGHQRNWWAAGGWYLVVTIATAGTFAWLPFLHASRRLRRLRLRRLAAGYGTGAAVMWVLASVQPDDAQGNPVGSGGQIVSAIVGILAIVMTVGACIQLWPLIRELRHPRVAAPMDPALAIVLAARAHRVEARALAAKDPLLARDLRIGRPDLGRTYDDGGLVDLNGAPPPVIAEVCELDEATVAKIVKAREDLGGTFSNIDEAFVLADLPVSTWDRIRDRSILLD
jgi:hypothetical protein